MASRYWMVIWGDVRNPNIRYAEGSTETEAKQDAYGMSVADMLAMRITNPRYLSDKKKAELQRTITAKYGAHVPRIKRATEGMNTSAGLDKPPKETELVIDGRYTKIETQKDLIKLAKDLGVREDWHEPDEQGVDVKVHGKAFDNAGFWGPGNMSDKEELWVSITKDKTLVACVNLATLFAWASGLRESKGRVWIEDHRTRLMGGYCVLVSTGPNTRQSSAVFTGTLEECQKIHRGYAEAGFQAINPL